MQAIEASPTVRAFSQPLPKRSHYCALGRSRFACFSWRCPKCRRRHLAQSFARLRTALTSRVGPLFYLVLKVPMSTRDPWRAAQRGWNRLLRRATRRFGRLGYALVWEQNDQGHPHANVIMHGRALTPDRLSDFLRENARACGLLADYCEPVKDKLRLSGYMSKASQLPLAAPASEGKGRPWRRVRASRGFLPRRLNARVRRAGAPSKRKDNPMSNPMDAYHQSLAETQRAVLLRMENNRVLAQRQEIQKTQDDSKRDQERLREAEEIAAQVWDQSRRAYDPVNIDKSVTGPVVQLIREAIHACVSYGVPVRMIPPFTTNPAYFAKKANCSAAYDGNARAVLVNLASPVWKQQAERPITDWDSTVGLAHGLVHEVGHSVHHANVGSAWTRPFTPDAKFQEIAKRVSGYAATKDHHEFVAETFAALVSGRQLDADVLAMYSKFGGWRPSGVQKADSAPPVPINVVVNVPPQPAPVIHVPAPVVHVNVAPELKVPVMNEQTTVTYDQQGRIKGSHKTITPQDDQAGKPSQVVVNVHVPEPQVVVNPSITVEQKPVVETFEVFRDRAGNMTGGRKITETQE